MRRAMPQILSTPGLDFFLCGIAEEPFLLRAEVFFSASLTLSSAGGGTSRAIWARVPAMTPKVDVFGVVVTPADLSRYDFARPILLQTTDVRINVGIGAYRTGQLADSHFFAVLFMRSMFLSVSEYQRSSFRPKVVGSAWTPWVRPMVECT